MTKVLCSLAGEGLGHALRSSIVIDELKNDGHEVCITSSGKAYNLLKERDEKVIEIPGFFLEIKNNKLLSSNAITSIPPFLKNRLPAKNILEDIIKDFKPDIIINDFEPYAYWAAKRNEIPTISIDNINSMLRTNANFQDFPFYLKLAAKLTTKIFSPFSNHFFIPTFFDIEKKGDNISLVDPIIRPDLFPYKNNTQEKNFFLVYQTTNTNSKLIKELKKVKDDFIVYGFNKRGINQNLEFKKFSHDGFLEDLVNSKGVIMNGSFSLMSEAIYLNKPVFSEPIKNYYEQNLNAHYLEKMGLGKFSKGISAQEINSFSKNLDFYRENLEKINFDNNQRFFSELKNKINELKK